MPRSPTRRPRPPYAGSRPHGRTARSRTGLTPYADDVICGALVTLRATGHPAWPRLAQDIAGADLERATTATSAALLRTACEGWCIDELADLLRCLARGEDPTSARDTSARRRPLVGTGPARGRRHLLPACANRSWPRGGRMTRDRRGAARRLPGLRQPDAGQREIGGRAGRRHRALVAMATELNLDLLVSMGFEAPADASPNDMVVAIEADDDAAVASRRRRPSTRRWRDGRPRRAGSATACRPRPRSAPPPAGSTPTWPWSARPGRVAAIDAADALAAGLDVMVFSDNVSRRARDRTQAPGRRRGLLVMGPDCGTAVIDGVGLGFANVVRPGPVGIVAASGTGAQHLLTLLDGAGIGVLHCLGVGGRDLSAEVGGLSTMAALGPAAADADVSSTIVVSPNPGAERGGAGQRPRQSLGNPVVMGYLGAGPARHHRRPPQRVAEPLGMTWTAPDAGAGRRARAEQGYRARTVLRRAPCATRRWSSPPKRSARSRPTSHWPASRRLDTTWRRRVTRSSTSATTSSRSVAPTR